METMIDDAERLKDFLQEAELQQYYELFRDILKVTKLTQLKFVANEDLVQIGLSKPEQRRYKKVYAKNFPNPYITKLKKFLASTRKHESLAHEHNRTEFHPFTDNNAMVPTKHIISIEDIAINKELGVGQFGVVQEGIWSTGHQRLQVAIKCLGHERMISNSTEFLKEAAVMHSIDHPNIVRLYGVVLHLESLMLVTELAPLRSLLECLRDVTLRASFPLSNLCEFARQICDGMTYLENKRLIHRDLAARNILVFSKDRVKISDFGLSRALGVGKDYYQTNYNVDLKLPVAWCAPECILYLRFTSASDVWAFGVCLWEMFTYGFQPWATFTGQQILEAIDAPNFQRLERPECCPEAYYAAMMECWAHEPIDRPRFKDLIVKLREIQLEQQPRQIVTTYKPSEDLEQVPLINPSSPSPSTGASCSPSYPLLRPHRAEPSGADEVDLSYPDSKTRNVKKSSHKAALDPMTSRSLLNKVRCVTMGRSHKTDNDHSSSTKTDETNEYHEISDTDTESNATDIRPEALPESPGIPKGHGEFSQSLLDEMETMFRSLDGRRRDEVGSTGRTLHVDHPIRSHTLSKLEKKQSQAHTGMMKPMSAHDERTLATAVAMANEITTRSMNDLQSEGKLPVGAGERSKFHFRFPLHLQHHHNAPIEVDHLNIGGRHERRNFSEEAHSVQDIQSTITEESKMAYTSLIEEPTPATQLAPLLVELRPPALEPRELDEIERMYSLTKIDYSRSSNPNAYPVNVLPLPPRNAKLKLDYKPRHVRKHPLKLPPSLPQHYPHAQSPPRAPNISNIYQNTLNCQMMRQLNGRASYSNSNHLTDRNGGVDVCDAPRSPRPVRVRTNPFARREPANPFDNYVEPSAMEDTAERQRDEPYFENGSLVKDSTDRVSVEDLLEFADQKPCGRQRGVESDEVRIMNKVLQQQATPEKCLETLELCDWNVHQAIKVMRVKIIVGPDISLEQCQAAVNNAGGDVHKASAVFLMNS